MMTTKTNSAQQNEREPFEPSAWLARFEGLGGSLVLDEAAGECALVLRVWRNPDLVELQAMERSVTPEQTREIAKARLVEAERFDPAAWVAKFETLGGSVQKIDGRIYTGMAPERDAAQRFRDRLLASEKEKLRSHFHLAADTSASASVS